MSSDRALLGYLAEYVSASGAFYGGILVVNEKGLPREFRHTDGVNPSRIQRALYGDRLLASVGSEALGVALVRALTQPASVLLVDAKGKPLFGDFALAHPPAALLVTAPTPETIFLDQIGESGDMVDAIQLTHRGAEKGSVFAYIDEGEGRTARHALEIAQGSMNLMSPFDRVRAVLAQIAEIEEAKGRK